MQTIILRVSKNLNGNFMSPSYKVPLAVTWKILFQVPMSVADMQNSANQLSFTVWYSDENINWKHGCSITFEGGSNHHLGKTGLVLPGPGLYFDSSFFAGKWVRLEVTTNRSYPIALEAVIE